MFFRKPEKKFFDIPTRAKEEALFTPDAADLYGPQPTFMYGDTKEAHNNHYMIENNAKVCDAYSQDTFLCYKRKIGQQSFPIALEQNSNVDPRLRIRGELHVLSAQQIITLDRHYLNGVKFVRKEVSILALNIRTWVAKDAMNVYRTKVVKAWMYVGKTEYWKEKEPIDAGYFFKPVTVYPRGKMHPNDVRHLTRYYEFGTVEYHEINNL